MQSRKDDSGKIPETNLVVHVVSYICDSCLHEEQDIKYCEKCGMPLRVFNVSTFYGEEAEKQIRMLEETKSLSKLTNNKSDEEDSDLDMLEVFAQGDIFGGYDEGDDDLLDPNDPGYQEKILELGELGLDSMLDLGDDGEKSDGDGMYDNDLMPLGEL